MPLRSLFRRISLQLLHLWGTQQCSRQGHRLPGLPQPVTEQSRGYDWAIPAHCGTPPMVIFALSLPICLLRTFSELCCVLRLFLPIIFLPSLSLFTGVRPGSCLRFPLPTPALCLSLSLLFILQKHFPQEISCISNSVLVTESQRT